MNSTLEIRELEGISFLDIPSNTLFRPFAGSDTIYYRTESGGAICVYTEDERSGTVGYITTDEQMQSARLNQCIICPPNEQVTLSNN